MGTIRLLWRDADRLPHLYAVRRAAAAYGTEVELQRQGGQEYAELLFDGRAEMLAENYWNQQLNRAQGTPIVAVAAAVNTINERLYVRPGIASLAELRGKRIAVRDARPTNLIDPLWLRRAGLTDAEVALTPDADVGRWATWKRVVEGDCDAAIVTNLFSDAAVEAGLAPLDLGPFGFLGGVVFMTSADLLEERSADIENVVRGAFDAATLFRNDKAAALDVMASIPAGLMKAPGATVDTPEERERVHRHLAEELADPPMPTPEAIGNFYDMAVDAYPELAGYNPLQMWDLRIASRIHDERRLAGGTERRD